MLRRPLQKSKEMAGKKIRGKTFSNQRAQTINGFAHISAADSEINPGVTRQQCHTLARMAMTLVRLEELKSLSSFIRIFPRQMVKPESPPCFAFSAAATGMGTKLIDDAVSFTNFFFQQVNWVLHS
jgi:hypothetical protein